MNRSQETERAAPSDDCVITKVVIGAQYASGKRNSRATTNETTAAAAVRAEFTTNGHDAHARESSVGSAPFLAANVKPLSIKSLVSWMWNPVGAKPFFFPSSTSAPEKARADKSGLWSALGFLSAGFCNVRVHHFQRIDDTVELVFRYKCELQRGLLEGEIVVQRIVGDFRGFVVADDRGERGYQHQ